MTVIFLAMKIARFCPKRTEMELVQIILWYEHSKALTIDMK